MISIIADDYGMHRDINRGIIACVDEGIVTGTSVAACGEAVDGDDLVALRDAAVTHPGLDVGVHLMLSEGRAITGTSSFTDSRGNFPAYFIGVVTRLALLRIRSAEVEREWDAQIRRLRDAGLLLTHLDSHQHVHLLPGLWPIALRLARMHGIPRIRTSYQSVWSAVLQGSPLLAVFQMLALLRFAQSSRRTLGVLCSTRFSCAKVLGPLTRELCRRRDVEIMVHPGVSTDALLHRFPRWCAHWGREVSELRLLKSITAAWLRDKEVQAHVMDRYRGQPWRVRAFVQGRARLCPFWVVEALVPRQGRILDVGCGHGHFSHYLCEASAERSVLGVDGDARKIAVAKAAGQHATAEFVHGRGDKLFAVDTRRFDAAVVLDVLYQLPFEAQQRLIALVHDRLVDGGVLVIKETDRHFGLRYALAYLEECAVVSILRRRLTLRYYYRSAESWKSVLEQSGFRVECCLPTPGEAINNRSVIIRAVRSDGPHLPRQG